MKRIGKSLLPLLMMLAMASLAFGQGPLHKRVNYTINVSHALRMGDHLLSPGRYVIYQIDQNDLNLFALYPEDLSHSPVAMIRTTRVEHDLGEGPSRTALVIEMDESSSDTRPVLRGWEIPGMDGWQIISVVAKSSEFVTRIK